MQPQTTRIEIEDDSDCSTCTRRNADEWEMLRTVKVEALPDVTCPECGRSVTLLVEP